MHFLNRVKFIIVFLEQDKIHTCISWTRLIVHVFLEQQHVSQGAYWFYMIELGFYWSLTFTLLSDHKRKVSKGTWFCDFEEHWNLLALSKICIFYTVPAIRYLYMYIFQGFSFGKCYELNLYSSIYFIIEASAILCGHTCG